MRASRLLTTLLLLQNRGRMTASQLAEELEVSVRTVYRDVDSLSAAGVPIYAERGPAGGYRLLAGYRTRLTGLTPREAESLLFTALPGAAHELGIAAALAAAELKLMAALPEQHSSRLADARDRFHLDVPGWFRDADAVPHLAAIADAVWHQRVITVRYQRWGPEGPVTCTLHPLGLVLKAGIWYLVARSDERERTYRVSRIIELTSSQECFTRPSGFDLARYWSAWTRRFEADLLRAQATVRLSPRGVRLLPSLGPLACRAARDSLGEPDERGWVTAGVPIESFEGAVFAFLRFGEDLEVLAPARLRTRLADVVGVLARRYQQES